MTLSCLHLLLSAALAAVGTSFYTNGAGARVAAGSAILMSSKSGGRMPNFSQEDLEMINSISSGNMRYPKPSPVAAPTAEPAAKTKDVAQASGSDDEVRRVKKVIKFPVKKRPAAPSAVVAAPAASAALGNRKQAIQATENNKVKDSGDWQGKLTQATSSLDIRSAMTQASYSTSQPSVSSASSWRPPTKTISEETLDFDYDDFEMAMDDIDNSGFGGDKGVKSFKVSVESAAWEGREIGDTVSADVWSTLCDSEGTMFRYSRLHKETASLVVVFVDPRRTTDEFKQMIEAFNRLPVGPMGIAVAVVNTDDKNEHRKLLKKNPSIKMPVLSDPSKKLVDIMMCRGSKRLESVLFILEVKTCSIINIWYEGDIDAITTKDLIVDEITKYRKNPAQYVKTNKSLK